MTRRRTESALEVATTDELVELLTRLQLRSARFLHLFTPEDEVILEDLPSHRRDAVERIIGARAAIVEQTAELRRVVEISRQGWSEDMLPDIAEAVFEVVALVDDIENAERWELRLAF